MEMIKFTYKMEMNHEDPATLQKGYPSPCFDSKSKLLAISAALK